MIYIFLLEGCIGPVLGFECHRFAMLVVGNVLAICRLIMMYMLVRINILTTLY